MSQHWDETFMLFVMRDYDRKPVKEDRKKDKLMGERLENAMKFFNEMMTEIK